MTLDLVTGEYLEAATVMGMHRDKVSQLRLELRSGLIRNDSKYACPLCLDSVYVVSLAPSLNRMRHIEMCVAESEALAHAHCPRGYCNPRQERRIWRAEHRVRARASDRKCAARPRASIDPEMASWRQLATLYVFRCRSRPREKTPPHGGS